MLTGEARKQLVNEEQPIHPLYAYLYVVDKYEGLIPVNAATLLDGDPLNNYLKRALDPAKYPWRRVQSRWRSNWRKQHNDCWKVCLHHDPERCRNRQYR